MHRGVEMSRDLIGEALPRDGLTAHDVQEMFAVFQCYFENTTPETFSRDLDNKDWVIVLRDPVSQDIQGFSTLACYASVVKKRRIGVVYSGDTIIRPAYWGTSTLPRTWIKTVLRVSEQLPKPLYWLLISSGYKTYRFLSVFFFEFYPSYDRQTPSEIQEIMHYLAHERFGSDYDPESGIVRFSGGGTPLRKGVAEVSDRRLQDPHIAYFIGKNPGHARGDELVCLAQITPENLTAAGKRMTR
jgi:hypothetical protein